MRTFEEKKETLLSLAELYLDSKDNSYIDVNDGVLNTFDRDSMPFLMLMALTNYSDGTNFYELDIEVDHESQKDFVDKEFKKITSLKCDLVKKGKIILADAKNYYNDNFNDVSEEDVEQALKYFESKGINFRI